MYLLVVRVIIAHSAQTSYQVPANIGYETGPHSSRNSVTLLRLPAMGEVETESGSGEEGRVVKGVGKVGERGEQPETV